MFRLLASDIDGTLTDSNLHLDPRAILALQRLEAAGLPVALATGNALAIGYTLRSYLGASGPIICENGGVIMNQGQVELIGDRKAAIESFEELQKTFPNLSRSFTDRFRSASVSMYRTEEYLPLKEIVEKNYPSLTLFDSGYAYHLIDKKVSKGQGLKRVAQILDIDVKDIVAVGDSDVDVPMFEVAGFSIAMANASGPVKRKAKEVTSAGFGEGFVEAVDRWILPEATVEGHKH